MVIRDVQEMFLVQAEVCGYGEMSNFGESISDAIFKRVDRDNDGCLNFLEMNTLQRALGGTALEYPGKYTQAMAESGFETNDKMWLTKKGLSAYYERHGKLAEDTEYLGVGSVDDYACASVSLTGEIKSKVVAMIDKLFDAAREAHYGFKLSSFIGRFTKDLYLDWECKRLSDLFVKGDCPTFITSPGWPAIFMRKMRATMADGRKGLIPEFRLGVEDYLGKGWGWSEENEWTIYSEGEKNEIRKREERDKIERIVESGVSTGINVEEYGIGTLEGWKEFKLADGSQPLWLKQELQRQQEEEDNRNFMKDSAAEKFSEFLHVPIGTTTMLKALESELESLGDALNKALPRRQREQLESMQEQKRADYIKNSELLEKAMHVSCHHALRSYDAMRSTLDGIHSVNWGNRAFTMRAEMNGFNFFEHLPKGMFEESDFSAAYIAKMKRAHERKARAKKHIDDERAKALLDEKERSKRQAESAIRKARERAEEEKQLYSRGSDARIRGYNKTSDQKLCIEMWRRLYLLFENRYNELNSSRDIHAVSVASNNIGVVMFEFGEGQMSNVQESITRMRKADELISAKLKELKQEGMEKALKAMKEKRLELEEIAKQKNLERIKMAQEAKGVSDRKQSIAMMDKQNKEARLAEQSVEEANKLAKELMREFDSDLDDEDDENSNHDNENDNSDGDGFDDDDNDNDIEEEKKTGDNDNQSLDSFEKDFANDEEVANIVSIAKYSLWWGASKSSWMAISGGGV